MIRSNPYADLYGNPICTSSLDDDEWRLVEELEQFAKGHPDIRTGEYWNFYIRRVGEFYECRGLTRREITKTPVWRLAQDIRGRMMIAAGLARRGDYRNDLEHLILERFPSRRAFCEATGISEDMLSHVLAKRKHLSIDTLSDALGKIGYIIQITPTPDMSPPSQST
jgi:hypothetical protein